MDIEFITQQQPVETLCFHFILNQTSKSKVLIVNSILMQLTSHPHTLHELFQICARIVEDSSSSATIAHKDSNKNMAVLLREIITKYPSLLPNTSLLHLINILTFCCKQAFCAVAGNDFISVVALLLQRIQLPTPSQIAIYEIVQSMLMDSKMHIGSYRQITRNHLLTALYKILRSKTQQQLTTDYLKKIIRLVEDEKDPRNISIVFQIYLQLLERSSKDQLLAVKKEIFDGLEMYYPIDFQGDTDKHSISLQDISFLLDQCLTNVIFADELRALLMVKMGAAPVSKYISTFINTRHHPRSTDSVSFWLNLLLRTAEEEYLQEEYPQNCQYTLSNLIIELLNRLVVINTPIPYHTYSEVTEWMDRMITKQILRNEDNSKYANLIIMTLKDIMNKCTNEVKYMVASFAVCRFVQYWKEGVGDIVFKLGILVPVLQSQFNYLDSEQIGLFIISLAQIFHTSQDPQPKLIVLKLYMILSNSPLFSKMIAKTNLLLTCLQQITNQSSDPKVIKAFLDFLIDLYAADQRVQDAIVGCSAIQIKVYGLLTLAYKYPHFYMEINKLIQQDNIHREQYMKEILKNLKMFKAEPVFEIISNIKVDLEEKQALQLTEIIDEKSTTLAILNRLDVMGFLAKYSMGAMMYLCRNLWRPYLAEEDVRSSVKKRIQAQLSEKQQNMFCAKVAAFYNKSLEGMGMLTDLITHENIKDKTAYWKQAYCMLPIEKDHEYSKQECCSWPTLVHYCWSISKTINTDLIECLPTSILASEADRILPLVISNCDVHTLSKILSAIPTTVVVSDVIPFLRDFLETSNTATEVEKIVAGNRILLDLESRAKEDEQIHASLMKNKGRILVAIEERLLQHRKRRARQSSRTIFSLYNSLK